MALIPSLIIAALSRLIGEEIAAWSPWITRILIRLAVAWLPEYQRPRFREEWHSHVGEVPGTIGKLLAAAGFMLAASKMRLVASRNRVGERERQSLALLHEAHCKATIALNSLREYANDSASDEEIVFLLSPTSNYLNVHHERFGQLAALVSTTDKSLVARLVYWRMRREILFGFDQEGAAQMIEACDLIIKMVTEIRKR